MEIPPLLETTILMVEVGSTAHGTGIDGGEDHDQLAVVVETTAQLLGLDDHGFKTVMQRTQPEGSRSGPGDTPQDFFVPFFLLFLLLFAASGIGNGSTPRTIAQVVNKE